MCLIWWKTHPDGAVSLPHYELSGLLIDFESAAYDLGWVRPGFDWPSWKATPEAARLRDDQECLSQATPDQLARLLTTLIRQERFCEGTFASAFEAGLLLGILRRARALADDPEGSQA